MTKGKEKEKKPRRSCFEHSQLKMLFDVIRGKRKCNAASEYIREIDVEFDEPKKKKKRGIQWDDWL